MQATPYIILGIACAIEISLIIGSCIEEKNAYPLILLIPSIFSLFCQFGADSAQGDFVEQGCITVDVWNFFLGFFVISDLGVPLLLYHDKKIETLALGLMIGGAFLQVIGYYVYTCVLKKQDEDNVF